jgi:tRNA 2-thiouridine synthesizing protein E
MTMATHVYAGQNVEVDAEGYFTKPATWTRAIGEAIAGELGIAMTAPHWQAVEFARKDFAERGESPGMRRLEAQAKIPMKQIYQLFPKGPGKLIAKIAGIPKPKSCL